MDPIDDLRQRAIAAAARDEGTMARPLEPLGRLIIQPTSMSRVVWRISAGDEPARLSMQRQARSA
jgi:hypothetical protein